MSTPPPFLYGKSSTGLKLHPDVIMGAFKWVQKIAKTDSAGTLEEPCACLRIVPPRAGSVRIYFYNWRV